MKRCVHCEDKAKIQRKRGDKWISLCGSMECLAKEWAKEGWVK